MCICDQGEIYLPRTTKKAERKGENERSLYARTLVMRVGVYEVGISRINTSLSGILKINT